MKHPNKEQQFIDWLCGKEGATFPYLQDIPEVDYPIGFEPDDNN